MKNPARSILMDVLPMADCQTLSVTQACERFVVMSTQSGRAFSAMGKLHYALGKMLKTAKSRTIYGELRKLGVSNSTISNASFASKVWEMLVNTNTITVPLGGVPTPVTALVMPLKEFPVMETGLDAAPECEIPPSHFLRAMECASTDETRFVLNGVCLWVGPKTKKNAAHAIVGTDGRTMYAGNSLHFPWKHDTIIPKGDLFALLPADAPWRVRSVFTAADEKKKISESGFWRIATGRWSVEGKCVYGVFPNWRQVIPTDHPVGIELTAEALATLCAHVPKLPTQFDGDRVRTASVDVEVTADSLIASVGEARVTVPAVVKFHRGAPPLLTKFNREYFLRAPAFGLRSWGMDTEGPLAASSLDQTFVAMPLRRSEPPAVAPTTTKPVMVPVTVATPATP